MPGRRQNGRHSLLLAFVHFSTSFTRHDIIAATPYECCISLSLPECFDANTSDSHCFTSSHFSHRIRHFFDFHEE